MYAEADGEEVPLSLSEARSSEHPNYDDYHVERGVGLLRDLKVGAKKFVLEVCPTVSCRSHSTLTHKRISNESS